MNFNNFYLRLISSILHRSARCMIPVVPRTGRFGGAKNDTNSKRVFTSPLFYCYVTFKNLTPTTGFGYIFMLLVFLHDRHGVLPLLNFRMFQFICIFLMFFNVFMLILVGVHFGHLQKFQSAIDDMMPSKLLMLKKCRCA